MADIANPAVEEYAEGLVPLRDQALAEIEQEARAHRIPMIGPLEGQALSVIARLANARYMLDVGTATGYSAIWLARAAREQGGSLVGIELDPSRHAEAVRNLARAGLADSARVIQGNALEVLPSLADDYDLVFLDLVRAVGEEAKLRELYDLCVDHLKVGGVLLVDNVFHGGDVLAPATDSARAADALNRRIAADRRFVSTFLTIRDGVAVALKLSD
jgi:predicted O-methyltransferase YrrM